jgi:hypothetical protein
MIVLARVPSGTKETPLKRAALVLLTVALSLGGACAKQIKVDADGARVVAKDAYIYGYPLLENYRVMYAYAVYKDSGHYRAPFNTLAVVTPDTAKTDSTAHRAAPAPPFATAWLDLRKEPVVITVPAMKEGSRYDIQLIDLYTYHFGELGSAKDGIAGGSYLIVPPDWSGKTPDKITRVIGSETSFAFVIIRGRGSDIEATAATEAFLMAFDVERLSHFLDIKAPKSDVVIFPPYSQDTVNTPNFFQYLNFLLQFCPVHPSEIHERAEFAKLGIAAGKRFDIAFMNQDVLDAVKTGMADARAEIASAVAKTPEAHARYGTRADLKNDFLARAVAARINLYGPPKM